MEGHTHLMPGLVKCVKSIPAGSGRVEGKGFQRLIMVAELHVVYKLQSAALFSSSVIGSM